MNESQIIINKINKFFNKLPFIFYFIPFILHIFCTKYLINKELNNSNSENLNDILFDFTPDLHNYYYIVNLIIFILLIPLFINPKKKYFISIFKYFSIIIFIRCITTCVTIMPPIKDCKIKLENKNNIYNYIIGHCNDKIFSGHTSFMLILFFVIYKYKILKSNYLIIYGLLILLNSFLIILTRSHYTVDVILAYIIVISILLILQNL